VSNPTRKRTRVWADVDSPFTCVCAKFALEALSYVLLPIQFRPQELGRYEGKAIITSASGCEIVIRLLGKCV
jgi:hypothetical protein